MQWRYIDILEKICYRDRNDMFPCTTKRTETAMDQVGRTARQMTYFLSSRAIVRWCALCRGRENSAYLKKEKMNAETF